MTQTPLNVDDIEDECQPEVTTSSMLLEQPPFNDISTLLDPTKSIESNCHH